MKAINLAFPIFIILFLTGINSVHAQWNSNGSNLYNTNTGYVGIGNSSPTTLLYVAKNMTEPAITVRNLGGAGGATYSMVDQASGANWKFKATNSGGFKIRDHANALDVMTFEANSSANALYINTAGNVGMGTNAPSASAALEINSTAMGFLPPRMTSQQITMISSPANGLVVYNTSDEHLYIYSSQSASWQRVSNGSQTITPDPCPSFSITHTAGNVAPVTKTVTYGVVFSDLAGSDKCWITQNLGADHQATSVNDATEESAGWYWQFNRQQGYKHDGTTRTPNATWIPTLFDEDSDWIAANDPCSLLLGSSWRLPTSVEWSNADASGSWTDWEGPWNSDLKMHAAGILLNGDGSLNGRGSIGHYWSNSQGNNTNSWSLDFQNNYCNIVNDVKSYVYTLRCLREL
jgi:hypothetical protein